MEQRFGLENKNIRDYIGQSLVLWSYFNEIDKVDKRYRLEYRNGVDFIAQKECNSHEEGYGLVCVGENWCYASDYILWSARLRLYGKLMVDHPQKLFIWPFYVEERVVCLIIAWWSERYLVSILFGDVVNIDLQHFFGRVVNIFIWDIGTINSDIKVKWLRRMW